MEMTTNKIIISMIVYMKFRVVREEKRWKRSYWPENLGQAGPSGTFWPTGGKSQKLAQNGKKSSKERKKIIFWKISR